MNGSILKDIRKLLGVGPDCDHYDTDIIIHINSVFATLQQVGIGPKTIFSIEDEYATWYDFLVDESIDLNSVKTYMFLKVKMFFDPPASSFVLEAMNRQATELEYRMNCYVETGV